MKKKNTLGIIALILGILGLILSIAGIGALFGVIGLILAIIALAKKNSSKALPVVALILSIIAIVVSALMIVGDSGSEKEPEKIVYVDEADIEKVYGDANSYKGKYVKITGKVFNVEKTDNDIFLQMYEDIENSDNNTIIRYSENPDLEIKEDDYISVDGYITGSETYENMVGGEISAPKIIAKSIEKISYIDIVAPTISELSPEKAVAKQHDISLKVDKIEFAEKETRIYFTEENGSSEKFYFTLYDIKIIQGKNQYESDHDSMTLYESGIDELDGEILPGVTSSGCVVFPAIDSSSAFQIYVEGNSDDWELEFKPFTIDITP